MRETEQPLSRNVQSVSDPHLIERRAVLAFGLANEERETRVHQPHREPRVDAIVSADVVDKVGNDRVDGVLPTEAIVEALPAGTTRGCAGPRWCWPEARRGQPPGR